MLMKIFEKHKKTITFLMWLGIVINIFYIMYTFNENVKHSTIFVSYQKDLLYRSFFSIVVLYFYYFGIAYAYVFKRKKVTLENIFFVWGFLILFVNNLCLETIDPIADFLLNYVNNFYLFRIIVNSIDAIVLFFSVLYMLPLLFSLRKSKVYLLPILCNLALVAMTTIYHTGIISSLFMTRDYVQEQQEKVLNLYKVNQVEKMYEMCKFLDFECSLIKNNVIENKDLIFKKINEDNFKKYEYLLENNKLKNENNLNKDALISNHEEINKTIILGRSLKIKRDQNFFNAIVYFNNNNGVIIQESTMFTKMGIYTEKFLVSMLFFGMLFWISFLLYITNMHKKIIAIKLGVRNE